MKKKKKHLKKNKKKIRVRYGRLFILLLIILIISMIILYFINLRITNIFIINNDFLTTQEVIDIAQLQNYPPSLNYPSKKLEHKLEDNVYIKQAKVSKKWLTQVYIKIDENYPLFYYKTDEKTVLSDGNKVDDIFDVPTVINYVPNLKYQSLIEKMNNLNKEILIRISEIKYDPSDYDDERFLLYMKDGNYVYVTLYKFENLNKYIDIVKNFGNKKGIMYLDSGNYFEIREN